MGFYIIQNKIKFLSIFIYKAKKMIFFARKTVH